MDGRFVKHDTESYAKKRVSRLTARIAHVSSLHPDADFEGRSAKHRLKLDQQTLKRWNGVLDKAKEPEFAFEPPKGD